MQSRLPALHHGAALHGVRVSGWNWVLLTALFLCKTQLLTQAHLSRRQQVLQVQSMAWYKPSQQLLSITDLTTTCSMGRMSFFNLILEGCLMYVLACTNVIILFSKLWSTDTSPGRGWQNKWCVLWCDQGTVPFAQLSAQRWPEVTAMSMQLVSSEQRQSWSLTNLRAVVMFWSFSKSNSGPCLSSKEKKETGQDTQGLILLGKKDGAVIKLTLAAWKSA